MNRPSLVNVDSGSFLVTPGEMISAHMYLRGSWEQSVINISKYILADCDSPVVLDIGANFGAYAVPVSKFIESLNGTLYAFEPQRKIYNQLCGNIFLNELNNLFAYHCALGKDTSKIRVNVPDYKKFWNPGALSLDKKSMIDRGLEKYMTDRYEDVNMHTLDSFNISKRVCLIKLDVEGMELEVLKGGSSFLSHHGYPPIIFEIWKKESEHDNDPTISYLMSSHGYYVNRISDTEYIAQHNLSHVKRKYELDSKL